MIDIISHIDNVSSLFNVKKNLVNYHIETEGTPRICIDLSHYAIDEINEQDLYEFFEQFGPIKFSYYDIDKHGYYIEYVNSDDHANALQVLKLIHEVYSK